MKIKELHLRNIASIEEADIDFEKDLKDGITGKDANVFLISGDTGAGKSVILDGISMALYKKTPRCEGVANKKENDFTDAAGESISIGSIEQYTRLGISDKDKCYSEVAFVGNDGVDYRVKLSLGMLLGNTDKTTGKRPMKHRAPKWDMKIGTNDWTTTDPQVILSAVGLTFQQFGRMAMLAQGQFASFLTGDKKEREAILEQLTNTEHFTSYGKAIESLFKKAKEEKGKKEVEFNTESEHTLPKEKVDELNSAKADLEKKRSELDQKSKANEDTLSQVLIIETNRSTADRESAEKAKLEEIVKGEGYKSQKALIADWDATSTERQRLDDLKKAKSKLNEEKEHEAEQKAFYSVLASDLQARHEALEAQGNPQEAVQQKQKEIDDLTAKRDALNPARINDDLSKLSAKKVTLGSISTKADKIKEDETAAERLEAEIAADEKTDKANAGAWTAAQSEYEAAKTRCDEANSRLTTMSQSIDETMVSLRKRLADEHEDVCPLCGQKITGLFHEDDFRNIVTPFEKEYNAAKAAADEADRKRTAAKSTLDKFSGALQAKRKDLEKRKEGIMRSKQALSNDAAIFGIDIAKPLPEQLEHAAASLLKSEETLKAEQKKAEDLQRQISAAQNEKKPLDAALQKYNSDKQKISSIETYSASIAEIHPDWEHAAKAQPYSCSDIAAEWNRLYRNVSATSTAIGGYNATIGECDKVLKHYFEESGKSEADLAAISGRKSELEGARKFVKETDEQLKSRTDAVASAEGKIKEALEKLGIAEEKDAPQKQSLLESKDALKKETEEIVGQAKVIKTKLEENDRNSRRLAEIEKEFEDAKKRYSKWDILNSHFGGTRFRTLVQTYILRPLLNNANIYLEKITDRYRLTCSEDNEQLSILVLDRYNKDQIRSVTVLSGGERFMISLALSLALSSLNRPDMNVNILFIDEGFGTLDEKSLDSVMETLEKLQDIAGQSERRVGIISHREELDERIPVQIQVKKKGEGRSRVEITTTGK